MSGGDGPSGFDPSQKQSIGVIQMHGIKRSSNLDITPANGPWDNFGEGGLKHMSASVQFLK